MAAQAPKPEGAAGRGGGGKEAGARDRSGDYAVLWEAEHGGRGGGGGGGGAGPSPGGVPVLPLEAAGKALSRARDRCQSALRQLSEAHAQLEQEQERSRCLAERRAHSDAEANMAFDVRHSAARTGRAAVKTTKQVGKTAAKVTKKAVLLPSKTLKKGIKLMQQVAVGDGDEGGLDEGVGGGDRADKKKDKIRDAVPLSDSSMKALQATCNVLRKEAASHLQQLRKLCQKIPALSTMGPTETALKENLLMAAKEWAMRLSGELKALTRGGEKDVSPLDPTVLASAAAEALARFYEQLHHAGRQCCFLPQLVNLRPTLSPCIQQTKKNVQVVLQRALQMEHECKCKVAGIRAGRLPGRVLHDVLTKIETSPPREIFTVEPGLPRAKMARKVLDRLASDLEQAADKVKVAGQAAGERPAAQLELVSQVDTALEPLHSFLKGVQEGRR